MTQLRLCISAALFAERAAPTPSWYVDRGFSRKKALCPRPSLNALLPNDTLREPKPSSLQGLPLSSEQEIFSLVLFDDSRKNRENQRKAARFQRVVPKSRPQPAFCFENRQISELTRIPSHLVLKWHRYEEFSNWPCLGSVRFWVVGKNVQLLFALCGLRFSPPWAERGT